MVLIVTMAESGVTEESLRTKITEQLQATHVEIEDMSGVYPTTPPYTSFLDYSFNLGDISLMATNVC